jgi:hypothetical protein
MQDQETEKWLKTVQKRQLKSEKTRFGAIFAYAVSD